MDSKNYRHIVAQIKRSSLLPHCIYPSYNLLSIDTLLELSDGDNFPETIPCYVPFEYEMKYCSVFLPGCCPVDEATNLVKKKLRWEKKLNSREFCDLNSVINSVKSIKKHAQIKLSRRVRKYLEHFSNDPEPCFNGSYNWLYTGGSITSVYENGGTALICADYSGRKPGFNVVKLSESLDKVEFISFYQLKTFSPVLQITCKAKPENFVVCVRQKNQVSLFRIDGSASVNHPTKLWRKKTVGEKLITSSDISADCEQAAICDTNYDVHVIDVESGTKTFGFVGKNYVAKTVPDRWGQISLEDSGLYVTFRNRFHVIDLRVANERPKLSFDPSVSTNSCESISYVMNCADGNYFYLATTHSFLQVDLRMNKSVQKWTHLMSSPPQFASSVQLGSQEVVVLQSWKVDEVVGVTNDRVGAKCFLSRSLPRLLRSVKESMRLTRSQAECLHPSLTKRINFAIAGIQCLKSDRREVFMFTQNSGGDIFLSKMRKKVEGEEVDQEERKQEMESMKELESHLNKFLPRAVDKSLKRVDMSHVLEGMESSKRKKKPPRKAEMYWKYNEMYAPESLSICRDALAQVFLKVWGHGPEEESDEEDEITKAHEKVLEWMAKI